jgi:membrane associated rhomboid family serine protease
MATDTCYRHPSRETALSCSNCGRFICPECMTHAAVGVRCPECSGKPQVMRRAAFMQPNEPWVTRFLIAANVVVFLLTNKIGAGLGFGSAQLTPLGDKLALYGPYVAHGDYWRLLSSGFVHFGLLHLGFNMYVLYLIGQPLERYLGSIRFSIVYLVSCLAGSFGALLLSPNALTAGASGAIFGLMGAMFVLERQRGIALLGGSIGGLIVINLAITFLPGSGISIGGHLGGLVAGAASAFVLSGFGRGHMASTPMSVASYVGLVAIGAGAVIGSLAVVG